MMRRRDFLKACGAASTAVLAGQTVGISQTSGDVPFDDELVFLLSDVHIRPGFRTVDAFASRIETLLAMNPRPRHLLIYGDLSQFWGKKEDYLVLREMMRPVEEAGVRWDLAFGNHDRRAPFFEVFPERVQSTPNVPGKYVSIVETPRADFILLDTLVEGEGDGAIDEQQRAWLEKTLAGYSKPVFVGAHHPVEQTGLAEMLAASPVVAGYIFGHHHNWLHVVADGLPRLTLPSAGYFWDFGYVVLRFIGDEAVFELKIVDHFPDLGEGKDANPPEEPLPKWLDVVHRKTGEAFIVPLHKG